MLGLVRGWIGEGRLTARPPRTFDYSASKRCWGHDVSFSPIDNGMKLRANGWGLTAQVSAILEREAEKIAAANGLTGDAHTIALRLRDDPALRRAISRQFEAVRAALMEKLMPTFDALPPRGWMVRLHDR